MQIEKIKITDIIEYENNAKLHPNEQVQQIKNSIIEFGFADCIAVDENNVVIERKWEIKSTKRVAKRKLSTKRWKWK